VVLATPTTLIALLRSAAYLWQQEKIELNAKEISRLGSELYERLKTFLGHFENLGSSIKRAVESYNKAVGSMESRVLTSARKFKELGATAGEEIAELEPIDETPRALTAADKPGTEIRSEESGVRNQNPEVPT
jgi:DNA recombination protein RmuC